MICQHRATNPYLIYRQNELVCLNCNQVVDLELKEWDYPATFIQVHDDKETGYTIFKINDHINKRTYFRHFLENEFLFDQVR